jgi:hypothetical protein
MSRRGARLAVAVLFALAAAPAAWEYVRLERAIGEARLAAVGFEREAQALATSIVDLRGSQQAYVAAGQGTDFWTARVSSSLVSLQSRVAALRKAAVSSEAPIQLDSASATIESFRRMDLRARDHARSNQFLLASDLIFADGFEMTQALLSEIESARLAEREGWSERIADDAIRQHLLAGGVAGLGLFFLAILAFSSDGRVRPKEPVAPREEPPVSTFEPLALALDEQSAEPEPSTPVIDLGQTAQLCLDLARVNDSQQIPGLLDRAARLLDARGIVLWMADPDGRELVPTSAHGYAPSIVSRLDSIPANADNATAAAYREGVVHTVKGDASTNGAIVAPLIASGGCIGVMAAEVRGEREQQEPVRAVAAILAAQLATLVGVTPAEAKLAAGGE